MSSKNVLLIEAFYGGSHKQLVDLIYCKFSNFAEKYTMTAKKWHWRALTSPLHFAEIIPKEHSFNLLFTSSVLPLAELVALRPDLGQCYKIVYFHENQMVYPVREMKSRYFQHGYNEVLTCLVADKILFNSNFNKESFLSSMSSYFNIMPDNRPKNLENQIRPKCVVLYFPLIFPHNLMNKGHIYEKNIVNPKSYSAENTEVSEENGKKKLHIVWPHRWEHDKNPEEFFSVMFRLKDNDVDFNLSVIGETFSKNPEIFQKASEYLKQNIIHWGYKESKEEYYSVLSTSDVVVSTAQHEFFGVSMLEAVSCGCYPLCPKRLVYPEIYPDEYLYNTPNQLYKKLKYFCKRPFAARNHKTQVDISKFSWDVLSEDYIRIFQLGQKTDGSS